MERMLGPKRPFYKAGPVMRLEKIPPEEFAAFIDARFARSGMRPEAGLGAAIDQFRGIQRVERIRSRIFFVLHIRSLEHR